MNPYAKSEKAVRAIRQKIFDYPVEKEDQAGRVLDYLKKRMFRGRAIVEREQGKVVGKYSGLTRRELAKTGTCETDWN